MWIFPNLPQNVDKFPIPRDPGPVPKMAVTALIGHLGWTKHKVFLQNDVKDNLPFIPTSHLPPPPLPKKKLSVPQLSWKGQ